MEKHRFVGKTYEEAVNKAKIELQELEENLIIKVIDEKKSLLSKKCEIEVIEKREIKNFIKEKLVTILREMGYQAEVEIQVKQDIPTYRIYSNNDSLLIGKNGKNLEALQIVLRQIVNTETGINYRFFLDVSDYKEKNEHHLEVLAKRLAREVVTTKIEVKMDSMNSYERRIVHNVLTNNKKVYTESVGEEPNRCVVIKPRED
mgnify:FL=1